MRWFRFPVLFRLIMPDAIFRIRKHGRVVYLTFDDGPGPGTTPEIISTLSARNIPATFFCSGTNVEKYPELTKLINNNGFRMANHGFSHLRGRATAVNEYMNDIFKGREVTGSDLFRPPYGSLTFKQMTLITKRVKLIYWDLMVYDFDPRMSKEEILKIISRKIRPGTILVLHDSVKSKAHKYLNSIIDIIYSKGYRFDDLTGALN